MCIDYNIVMPLLQCSVVSLFKDPLDNFKNISSMALPKSLNRHQNNHTKLSLIIISSVVYNCIKIVECITFDIILGDKKSI